jgi:CP family cyanate transporter-like MFS transporter
MTGLYSGIMGVGAAFSSGVSVPLAQAGLGWRGSLAFWAIPVAIALLPWIAIIVQQSRRNRARIAPSDGQAVPAQEPRTEEQASSDSARKPPPDNPAIPDSAQEMPSSEQPTANPSRGFLLRSPLAWQITIFMGLQSFSFYAIISWLPALLRNQGINAATAGWLIALLQFVGFLTTFFIPLLAGRRADQRLYVLIFCILGLVALLGIMMTGPSLIVLWVIMLGLSQGAFLGLALLFFVVRAPNARMAAELSGMAQSIGYFLSAGGPIFFGTLHDLTQGWTVPLIMLLVVGVIMLIVGLGAGRNALVTQAK